MIGPSIQGTLTRRTMYQTKGLSARAGKGGGAHATLTMREKGEDRDVSSHESDKPGTHYPERGAIL